jgi:hypothetical protein
MQSGGANRVVSIEWLEPFARAVLAQWGADQAKADIKSKLQEAADQELEKCRQWLEINGAPCKFIDGLLAARCCSEPPSLKEEALDILNDAHRGDLSDDEMATIRRALEQLPDDN